MQRVVLIVALCASARVANAEDADSWFRKGKDLMAAGKIAEACDAFDNSQSLDPTMSTLMNQANCREKNNQLATALKLFREAQSVIPTKSDDAAKKMRQVAADRAKKLEARASRLTINAKQADGLTIERNGVPVSSDEWGRREFLDGGKYEIVARAPGHDVWSTVIDLKSEADEQTVEVPALKTITQVEARQPEPQQTVHEPRVVQTRRRSRMPLILGASAVVLVGGAVGFELWGRSIYNDAKVEPDDGRQDELWHSANSRRYVAEGLLVSGVALGILATWTVMRGDPSTTSTAQLIPIIDRDHSGLAFTRSF